MWSCIIVIGFWFSKSYFDKKKLVLCYLEIKAYLKGSCVGTRAYNLGLIIRIKEKVWRSQNRNIHM
jgi:hypothetical protein